MKHQQKRPAEGGTLCMHLAYECQKKNADSNLMRRRKREILAGERYKRIQACMMATGAKMRETEVPVL